MHDYVIQPGDTFFQLAKRFGCNCEELIELNPTADPNTLQVGQRIMLPDRLLFNSQPYAKSGFESECEFSGESLDDVQVEIEGIKFRVKRIGEHRVPREVHLILPRTEIHKIECTPQGNSELKLMISNINIVNSPRLMSEGFDRAETNRLNRLQDVHQNDLQFDSSTPWQNTTTSLSSSLSNNTSSDIPPVQSFNRESQLYLLPSNMFNERSEMGNSYQSNLSNASENSESSWIFSVVRNRLKGGRLFSKGLKKGD